MAVFYLGPRPVLRGRSSTGNVHPWKGTEEVYSNYSIYNSSQILDGAPNNDHTPGTGRHPHDLKMSRIFRGLENREQPLDAPGGGARIEGMRYRPLENKAAGNNKVFKSGFGHVDRVTSYSLVPPYSHSYKFQPLDVVGHAARDIDADGTANSFGRFGPHVNKGVTDEPLDRDGQTVPEGYDNEYGRNRVLEWQGIPSARAL